MHFPGKIRYKGLASFYPTDRGPASPATDWTQAEHGFAGRNLPVRTGPPSPVSCTRTYAGQVQDSTGRIQDEYTPRSCHPRHDVLGHRPLPLQGRSVSPLPSCAFFRLQDRPLSPCLAALLLRGRVLSVHFALPILSHRPCLFCQNMLSAKCSAWTRAECAQKYQRIRTDFPLRAPLSEPEGSIGRRVQRRVSRGMSGPVQCPVHDSAHFCTAHRNSVQTSGAADGHGLPVSLCLPPSPAPSALPFQKPCTTGSFCRTPGRSFCPLISCKRQYAGRTDRRVHLPQKPRNESFPGCRKSLPVQDPSKREADVQPQDMLNQNDFHAFSSFYPETEGLCFLTEAQRFTNQAP